MKQTEKVKMFKVLRETRWWRDYYKNRVTEAKQAIKEGDNPAYYRKSLQTSKKWAEFYSNKYTAQFIMLDAVNLFDEFWQWNHAMDMKEGVGA